MADEIVIRVDSAGAHVTWDGEPVDVTHVEVVGDPLVLSAPGNGWRAVDVVVTTTFTVRWRWVGSGEDYVSKHMRCQITGTAEFPTFTLTRR